MKSKIKMWEHQARAVEMAVKRDHFAFLFDTGCGKTLTAINTLRHKYTEHKRLLPTLVLCPIIVIENWKREILSASEIAPEKIITPHGTGKRRAQIIEKAFEGGRDKIVILNYESLLIAPVFELLMKWKPEVLVCDECFAEGTLVDTPKGRVPIENIKKGDEVCNVCGVSQVTATHKREVIGKVEVGFGGDTVTCSLNHPWLTSRGWVIASQLKKGDRLVRIHTGMRLVQEDILGAKQESSEVLQPYLRRKGKGAESRVPKENSQSKNKAGREGLLGVRDAFCDCSINSQNKKILRALLFSEMEDAAAKGQGESIYEGSPPKNSRFQQGSEASGDVRVSQEAQSYVRPEVSGEGIKSFKGEGMGTFGEKRKWAWPYRAREIINRAIDRCVGVEFCDKLREKTGWISLLLQGRPCVTRNKIGSGSRWEYSLLKKISGYKEGFKAETIRVESVKVLEQGNIGRHGPYTFYDLTVSGHPSFSVNGVVVHNSHFLKESRSKRTRACVKLSDTARYRYIMTGTPVLNSPMDLFSQFRVMDGGKAFGKNFVTFRATWFYDKNAHMPPNKYFPDWRIKNTSLDAFNRIIHSNGMVAKKSECLDLPPFIKKPVYVELAKEQKRVYEELKKDLITFLNDKACTAPLAITKSLRLQQIVSGFVMGEDSEGTCEVISLKDNPRANALETLLSDLSPSHKIIVWAVFKNNYKTIREVCEKLKLKYVEIHGEIKTEDKFANVDSFNNDPSYRVLIGHPNSGGVGINLVASSISIFYSRNFSLGQDLQAEARNYRGGSEIHESILRIDLIAKDTIDEVIQNALASKQKISDKLLRQSQNKF